MNITVDRTHTPEGNLVFTITASEANKSPFGDQENLVMMLMDQLQKDAESLRMKDEKLIDDVKSYLHAIKEKTFARVKKDLSASIRNDLNPKFEHICQEIYNWIYDHQEQVTKTWMQDFDPQRTQYYFYNDRQIGNSVLDIEDLFNED